VWGTVPRKIKVRADGNGSTPRRSNEFSRKRGRQDIHGGSTLLASLFFMWGFITVINGTLLPHLRSVMDLSYRQTTLIESVWFIAYFCASIPSAKLIERIGYKRSMVLGLLVMAGGALLMIPASMTLSYGMVLTAMFIIASGITLLQVAANPTSL
jgi:FHS family L-fucose permease-like MFS transporter